MLKCKIYFTRAVITVRHGSEVIKRKNKPNFTRYQKINDMPLGPLTYPTMKNDPVSDK
jgi:CMP-N-acetylneuraminic acid synthetase